ncbi:MAG: hypothetical protein AVDCRST_MAG49-3344, partial [uncultured Thermomicrobiales bacterium]
WLLCPACPPATAGSGRRHARAFPGASRPRASASPSVTRSRL